MSVGFLFLFFSFAWRFRRKKEGSWALDTTNAQTEWSSSEGRTHCNFNQMLNKGVAWSKSCNCKEPTKELEGIPGVLQGGEQRCSKQRRICSGNRFVCSLTRDFWATDVSITTTHQTHQSKRLSNTSFLSLGGSVRMINVTFLLEIFFTSKISACYDLNLRTCNGVNLHLRHITLARTA